ncbi:MAG: HAD family hydrolase [Candidatus Sericytochromatia bacterium]|nr:HAD family hydrolase [Candidatus Sericytochromatia bacterium]
MPTLMLGGRPVEGKLLVFDKDGVLLDFHAFWVALSRARAATIARLAGAEDWAAPLLDGWGVGRTGRVSPTGVLATGTRIEACLVAATWLHHAGLPWTQARELAAEGFAVAEVEAGPGLRGRALPGTVTALGALRSAGWRLAVATTDRTDAASAFLSELGLREAFVSVVGGDRVPTAKPDPAMFLLACEEAGVAPGDALMVGDTDVDLRMGRRAGARATIGVLSGVGTTELLAPLADLVLPDVAALAALLDC